MHFGYGWPTADWQVNSLSENVCEEPVGPLSGVGVQSPVEILFQDGLRGVEGKDLTIMVVLR